jgi:signal transduction histidine kinase
MSATEEQRGRWARELHDGPLQHLGALRLRLVAARRNGDAPALRAAVDDVVVRMEEGIGELRGLIRELRPAVLDELGTAAAIEGLAQDSRELYGVAIHTRLHAGRFDPEVETTVYRLVENALVTAARDAGATTVWIEVEATGDAVRVEVRDDRDGPRVTASLPLRRS